MSSDVSVRELTTAAATERAAALLLQVWGGSEPPVPAHLLRTVQHIGGYAFGAYDAGDDLVAVSMGLLSREGLHSHITGVLPSGQRHGLGFALKQHQRRWALERGITTITWTCDPLVRRNMAFNLHALGATVVAYLPDHYGAMTDGVNKGDESDRFELRWDLMSARAVAAAAGRLPWAAPRGVLVPLPEDIEALRRADPAAARSYRRAVRDAVLPLLAKGAVIRGLTAAGELVLEEAP